jgi:hypothetical protein
MRYPFAEQIRRSRPVASLAVLVITASIAISSGSAQGRVEQMLGGSTSTVNQDTTAKATGGGTVLAKPSFPTTVGSFGVNARRPEGFSGGGSAEGRINYVRHRNMPGRHVNVPVVYMEAGVTPQPPNMTGGDALIIGDCAGATCPPDIASVIAYVKDVNDSGAGQDIFHIYFCSVPPSPPGVFVPGAGITDCTGPEGDTLRSGNIQVRGDAFVVGEKVATASGSGAYTSTPNVNGVEISGGTFALGLRTAGPSDLEANLNGVQPLLGLFQQLTLTGWVTSASVNGGTMTFSGTARLDMGDGGAPLTNLPLSGSLTATGLTLTVGSWSFGTLPKADGFITIE